MSLPETPNVAAETPVEVAPEAARRVVVVVLRTGALLLGAGAATSDVELTMRRVAAAFGLTDLQAIVAFGTIMVSYAPPGGDSEPITAIELVSERAPDYTRLSAAAALARSLRAGRTSLVDAQAELDRIAVQGSPWPRWLILLAAAASAEASTVLFGGGVVDAAATFVVGILVEPVVRLLDDSGLPPFFRSLIAPLVSALIVVAGAGLGLPVNEGLVLTGSLLRFLPGSALVAGMRDLIDQSIVSGSARLAEALLLGAAVAAGLAIALRIGTLIGISIALQTTGSEAWQIPVQAIAAGLACGFFAVRLGEPRDALLAASVTGAIGWAVYLTVNRATADLAASTLAAAIAVGGVGRLLARRTGAGRGLGRSGEPASRARSADRGGTPGRQSNRRSISAGERGSHWIAARGRRGRGRHHPLDRAAREPRLHRPTHAAGCERRSAWHRARSAAWIRRRSQLAGNLRASSIAVGSVPKRPTAFLGAAGRSPPDVDPVRMGEYGHPQLGAFSAGSRVPVSAPGPHHPAGVQRQSPSAPFRPRGSDDSPARVR